MDQPSPPPHPTPADPQAETPDGSTFTPDRIDAPPVDPYVPQDWGEAEWRQAADAIGMAPGELLHTLGPAREASQLTPDFAEVLDDETYGTLGNDPATIRILGRIGDDLRAFHRGAEGLVDDGTVAPLTGEALREAMARVLTSYFSEHQIQRFERLGLDQDPQAMRWLETLAQERHRLLHRLEYGTRRREATPQAPPTANPALERQYGDLVRQRQAANFAGDVTQAQALHEQLTAVGKRLFQGG